MVDGLKGGQGAIIQKLHHTMADGEGGIRLSDAVPRPRARRRGAAVEADPEVDARARAAAVDRGRCEALVAGSMRMPIGSAASSWICWPIRQIPAGARWPARSAAMVSQLSDTEAAHSPSGRAVAAPPPLETLQAPLDEPKAAAKKLGGTLNAFFVTAAAAAGEYHRKVGAPVE